MSDISQLGLARTNYCTGCKAADTIEAQAAEIKRLREALKPFAKSGDLLVVAEDKGDFWAYRPAGGDEYGITGRHLLAARAALGEPTGE